MSRWADWFTVTPAEAEGLRAAARAKKAPDAAVMKLLEPWLERLEELKPHVDMDKAWEPIHRCLTGDDSGDLDFEAGEPPLDLCVLGGEPLLQKGYRTASLVMPDGVKAVSAALKPIKKAWLRERFFALPDTQFHEIDDDMFEWTWEHFKPLRAFYAKAAMGGHAVVCTISH